MAIKNRILKNLNAAESNLNLAVDKNEGLFFNEALNNITSAQNLCKNGLTTENFTAYSEIYDGIVLALKNLINAGKVSELIDLSVEFLNYLKTQTQNEINFKKEIVFLPVQASMWDSLESVWKAAYDDKEHFITYVVPLPYVNLIFDENEKTYVPDKWHWVTKLLH